MKPLLCEAAVGFRVVVDLQEAQILSLGITSHSDTGRDGAPTAAEASAEHDGMERVGQMCH